MPATAPSRGPWLDGRHLLFGRDASLALAKGCVKLTWMALIGLSLIIAVAMELHKLIWAWRKK